MYNLIRTGAASLTLDTSDLCRAQWTEHHPCTSRTKTLQIGRGWSCSRAQQHDDMLIRYIIDIMVLLVWNFKIYNSLEYKAENLSTLLLGPVDTDMKRSICLQILSVIFLGSFSAAIYVMEYKKQSCKNSNIKTTRTLELCSYCNR